jgi:signal transduction histidine kinase
VRTSSLAALAEMRSMVLLLRAAEDPVMPGGLDRLPDLVATAETGGLTVQAHLAEIGEVPAVVAHTVYRIVREALTNAHRHAPAAHVRLDVSRAGDEVTVTVTNTLTRSDRDPKILDPDVVGVGIGLSSMRDRAALLGGKVTAGLDGDLWRVRATLPLRAEA